MRYVFNIVFPIQCNTYIDYLMHYHLIYGFYRKYASLKSYSTYVLKTNNPKYSYSLKIGPYSFNIEG